MVKKILSYILIAIAVSGFFYALSWCADWLAWDFMFEFENLFTIIVLVICTCLILYRVDSVNKK